MDLGTEEILLNRKYPAKVLLFGEYGVLEGSMGLAIPLPVFAGRWILNSELEILEEPLLQFLADHFPHGRKNLILLHQEDLLHLF